MTTATKVTIARIALIPVFIVLFLVDFPYHYLVAGLVYILSAATDSVDGAIARKTGTVSKLGKILDPIADKALSIPAMIICVAFELFHFNVAFIVMVSLMIVREMAVSIMRLVALYHGKTLAADALGKIKTIFINIAVPTVVINKQFEQYQVFNSVWKWIGSSIFLIAFVLTIWSGINYFVKNKEIIKSFFKGEPKERKTDETKDK